MRIINGHCHRLIVSSKISICIFAELVVISNLFLCTAHIMKGSYANDDLFSRREIYAS